MIESRSNRKLASISKTSSTASSTISLEPLCIALDGCDPLTLFAKQESMDPLSQMAAEYVIDFFPLIFLHLFLYSCTPKKQT